MTEPTVLHPRGAGARRPMRLALVSSALLLGQTPSDAAGESKPALAKPAAGGFDDGSQGAPPGPAQLPGLLAGYAVRPPWAVAGVDYATGAPRDLALKDPATISTPGVTADLGRLTVYVSGDDVELDGYDFGLSGGWGVYISPPAAGTVIRNSSFHVGARHLVPIHAARGTGGLTVRSCTFDGGAGRDDAVWALIAYSGSGKFIAEHNWFAGAPSDAIDFDSGSMTTIVRYNLFENLGTAPGSHPDSVQYVGVQASGSVIDFNAIYQPHPSGMQGIQLSAQLSSRIAGTRIANNTIIAKGPGIDMSYLIAVGETPDSEVDDVVVADNYLDVQGAYGPFYPPTGKHLSFVGNLDAASGRVIDAPAGASATDVAAAVVAPAGASAGATITITLVRAAFVTGEPVIRLADGRVAVYADGSGSRTLVFNLVAGASSVRRAGGGRIVDANGNAVDVAARAKGLSAPATGRPPRVRHPDPAGERPREAVQAPPDGPSGR